MTDTKAANILLRGIGETIATSTFLSSGPEYPLLHGQQPDLYRAFIAKAWANAHGKGVVTLIHPRTHMTEKGASLLRRASYTRLRRYWHLTNKLGLFDINKDEKNFDVAVYAAPWDKVAFLMCGSAHHPQTIIDSLSHDGSGPVPAFKNEQGKWDLRPHKSRIQFVNTDTLRVWKSLLEEQATPDLETRMIYTVNTSVSGVLAKLSSASRIRDLDLKVSRGWDETIDRKKGYFDIGWRYPDDWSKIILQGTHIGVATPMIKVPNSSMRNKDDWSETDMEAISATFIPATRWQPIANSGYDEQYDHWTFNGRPHSAREFYRVAWRKMAAPTGFRTLYPAIIPPGSTHLNGILSAIGTNNFATIVIGASASSFLVDFAVRSTGVQNIYFHIFESLPRVSQSELASAASILFLRLNCVTSAYAPLWEELTGEQWTTATPIRNAKERIHAQNEIDAIVALSLGVTADELCMIYRTQFPVMRRYDQEDLFDANGRKVAGDVMKLQKKLKDGEELSEEQRTWTHPQSGVTYVFEYPFAPLDREADLRRAYAKYEKILEEQQ